MAKPLLRISLATHCLLLGALAYMVLARPADNPLREEAAPVPSLAAEPHPSLETPPPPAPEPTQFRWSQLESPDYPTYIANLRGIGCPEPTVRDIITADIENLYVQKRRELRTRGMDPQELARELESLRQQQCALIVRLLGVQTDPQSAPEQTVSPSVAEAMPFDSVPPQSPPVNLPLVLCPPDPALKLTVEQKELWNELSKDFVDAIGGPNQDPNNPEYLQRWNKARSQLDAQFKILFGEALYQKAALDLSLSLQ